MINVRNHDAYIKAGGECRLVVTASQVYIGLPATMPLTLFMPYPPVPPPEGEAAIRLIVDGGRSRNIIRPVFDR